MLTAGLPYWRSNRRLLLERSYAKGAQVDSGYSVDQLISEGLANDYEHKRVNGEADGAVNFKTVAIFLPIKFSTEK